MSGDAVLLTLVGNVVRDPELRHTPSGVPVASFTIAANKRKRDPQTNEWSDSPTVFMRVSCWRVQAEHVYASLRQGDRAVVTGELVPNTNKEGNYFLELEARDVAISLRYKPVQPRKERKTTTTEASE